MEQKKKALGRGLEELFSTEVLDFDPFESNLFPTIVDVEDGNHFYFFLLNMVAPIINSFINGSFFFASIVMAVFIKPKNYQQFTPFENYKDYSDFHSQDTISSNEIVKKDQPYEL